MPAPSPPPAPAAPGLIGLQLGLLLVGATVLTAAVALVVWGPRLGLPGLRSDPLLLAAGSVLLGTLALGIVQGLLLRGLAQRLRLWQAAVQRPAAAPPARSVVRPQGLPAPRFPATRDSLTGLLDGPAFHARLTLCLQQTPPVAVAALLIIDLDRFKQINEHAGRAAGDALLRQAAAVLQAHVRQGDAVARLEGDSYAMLLPGCEPEQARLLGERLRSALAALGVDHQGRRLGVGATVGVAALEPAARDDAEGWMARAKAAWYEAKYGGQGAVRMAAPATQLRVVLPA